jgi:hypothetical protein
MYVQIVLVIAMVVAAAGALAEVHGAADDPLAGEAEERGSAEIAARNALFEELDMSGDGLITRAEAQAMPELLDQFDDLDRDGDGGISRQEFAAFETDAIVTPQQAQQTGHQQAPQGQVGQQPGAAQQPRTAQQPGAAEQSGGVASLPRPGETPRDEPAPNVLVLRAEVAAMAYETVEALETHTTIPMAEPVGWAVFSALELADELAPGTGMARHERGEEYFLYMSGLPPIEQDQRFVMTFRDEGLFREFRQGQLDGPTLERARAQGFMDAYQVTVADGLEVQPTDIGSFAFELDDELERALIGVPSVTEELVDPEDPWTWNR